VLLSDAHVLLVLPSTLSLQDDKPTAKVNILLQVARALAWLHSIGYTHMDVKCANILVDFYNEDDPMVLLSDMGVSKYKTVEWFQLGMGTGSPPW
jgi:serine/threonine protein kinase